MHSFFMYDLAKLRMDDVERTSRRLSLARQLRANAGSRRAKKKAAPVLPPIPDYAAQMFEGVVPAPRQEAAPTGCPQAGRWHTGAER
jgi:hypothetical protein